MIEFGRLLPVALCMATGAIFAQCLLVFVIIAVTGITVLGQLVLVQIARVAVLACRAPVPAPKYIPGVHIVIEAGDFPLTRCMACFTPLTKISTVSLLVIVLAVACDAGNGGAFVRTRLVAISALDFCMFSDQRETGGVMVEPGFLPVQL